MAGISSLGIGSGLDLDGIVKNLMSVEQQPLVALAKQEASVQSKISALGSLKSALSSLLTVAGTMVPDAGKTAASKFTSFSTLVGDTSIAGATASTGAVAGSYSLEVTQLAKPQRLVTPQTALPDPAKYASGSAAVQQGTLKIELGTLSADGATYTPSSEKSIVIDSSNATLAGLRDAINNANAGVTATIMNSSRTDGSTEARLVMTNNTTGLKSVARLSGIADFAFDPTTAAVGNVLTQAAADGGQAPQNAKIKLNGIEATSSTNSISDVLDGVTINLVKETGATPTTLTVAKDYSPLTSHLNTFVKVFNETNKTLRDLGFFDGSGSRSGALLGNSTLRNAQSAIRDAFFGTPPGLASSSAYQRLSDIGVSIQKDGSLILDNAKLKKATDADFTAVANLVAGVGTAFKNSLEGLAGAAGSISSASDSLNLRIQSFAKQREAINVRLASTEARYRKQFAALDTLISNFNQTGAYLTQQLKNLPKIQQE